MARMTKLKQKPSTNVVLHPAAAPPRGRRAEDKWSKQVMKFGYTTVPNLLLRVQGKLGISPDQFNVLLHLIEHWWDAEKDPYPGKDTIARRMGRSSRMIQRYVGAPSFYGFELCYWRHSVDRRWLYRLVKSD
jgi:hypothetical protein